MNSVTMSVTYDDSKILFVLRVISVAEETKYASRFLTIPDSDSDERKAEQEYDIFVDSLATWAKERLMVLSPDGTKKPLYFNEEHSAADSVREFFKDKDPIKERIAPALVGQYRLKLQPDVVFY